MAGGGSARLSALEKKIEDLELSIMKALEECLQNRRSSPEAGPMKKPTAAGRITQLPSLPKERGGGVWKAVEPRKRKKRQKRRTKAAEKETNKDAARTNSPASGQQSGKRMKSTPRPSAVKSAGPSKPPPKRTPAQANRRDSLPRSPRSSAVSLTLSEGAKLFYAEVMATTREKVPLAEVGIQFIRIRKAITGAIILEIPANYFCGLA
jgi:hypothetical protein